LGQARTPATLLAGRCRGPGRQNSLASCSTGSDAAFGRGGLQARQELSGPALVESCNDADSISSKY